MPRRLILHAQNPEPHLIAELQRHLHAGGVAALPTDTIYGLAANGLDAGAVARVFGLKGRAFDKPLPLVVRDLEQATELGRDLPPLFFRLAAAFWPGPLTLVVGAAAHLPAALTAGSGTVGMRQPNLPLLRELLATTGYPLTATSANRSGQPECRDAAAVAAQFGDEIEGRELLLVDGGPSPSALPSTMVDLTQPQPRLLRVGAISESALAPFW